MSRPKPAQLLWLTASFIACVAPTGIACAQSNLGFEQEPPSSGSIAGWQIDANSVHVELDAQVVQQGAASLRVQSDGPRSTLRLNQSIDTNGLSGNRIRVVAYINSDGSPVNASISLRVDGTNGLLYLGSTLDSADAEDHAGWRRIAADVPLSARATRLRFGVTARGSGTFWLDSFSVFGLDTQTFAPPTSTARSYLNRALDIMEENSINRNRVDWPTLRADAMLQARGAANAKDTYPAIHLALADLEDGHSYLQTPERTTEIEARPVSNARTGRRAIEPSGQLMDERYGYVAMPGFAGGRQQDQARFAAALQSTIATQIAQGACGWIVDLRGNSGGNLWPMLAGIGPLLGDGDIGSAVYPDRERRPIWYRQGRAGFGDYVQLRIAQAPVVMKHADTPVAVLIDQRTASSAEVIAMAFHDLGHARLFGMPTRGLGTGNRTYELSDGASLILTVAGTSDRSGKLLTGPITPDVELQSRTRGQPRLPIAAQPAVRAAGAWLNTQPNCG